MYATISKNGVINRVLITGSHNADHLFDFVGGFYNALIPANEVGCQV